MDDKEKMTRIGIFYGSNGWRTEHVAYEIKKLLDEIEPGLSTVFNIARGTPQDIEASDYVIFGVPSWNIGQLQDDWGHFFPRMNEVDLQGVKVAIFGLGDQDGYPTTFLDAVGILGKKAIERGGELVGYWPARNYQVEASLALEGDQFMGLAIDEDSEPELTPERIRAWVKLIVEEFGIAEGEVVKQAGV